jgi:Fur family peroxide stress response transcriptional regulator
VIQKISFEEARERLMKRQLKATPQRVVIYEALVNMNNHPTAEMIYEHIHSNNPSISLATVYKTLDTFVEAKLADKVLSDHGVSRYDGYTEAHNHLYCTNTDELIDYEDEELIKMLESYFEKKNITNFKIQDIRLQVLGEKINVSQQVELKN